LQRAPRIRGRLTAEAIRVARVRVVNEAKRRDAANADRHPAQLVDVASQGSHSSPACSRGAQHLSRLDKRAADTADLLGYVIDLHQAWKTADIYTFTRYDRAQLVSMADEVRQMLPLLAEMTKTTQ
jgi:hypothetical protein